MNLLRHIFKRNKPDISKLEYWDKWELRDLLEDLHLAEDMLENYTGGYSGEFLSAEEFADALSDAVYDIEFGNKSDLSKFWIWFAPTCTWADFVGMEGTDLGNRIFSRVNKWQKAYDKEKFYIRK